MLETDGPDGLAVHGPAFECFRDSEVSVGTLEAQAPHMVDRDGGGSRRRRLATARHRLPASLAWPGTRPDPPSDGGDRQRGKGPVCEGRARNALAAARRHDDPASSSRTQIRIDDALRAKGRPSSAASY